MPRNSGMSSHDGAGSRVAHMTHGKKIALADIGWRPDKNGREPICRQIVDFFSGKISAGDWTPGMLLPSQRDLAQAFGVNRSTIVTAIAELSSFGVVEPQRGKGTAIAGNGWSLLMSRTPPNWSCYLGSGSFKENVPTIQAINRLEFQKDIIRLGTGELAPALFPKDMMREAIQAIGNHIPSLGYLEPLGLPELRETLSRRLRAQGIEASPSSILVTSGSLQALQLISVSMLRPGATVYTEAPSYIKSLQVFQSAGIDLKGIPMDRDGIQYWNIAMDDRPVSKDALLYTIPTFQNPTGTTMGAARRREVFSFCSDNMLPMIEDDAYGELWFENRPPPPIKTMDRSGTVLYTGTMSKTLAPGLRLGWLVGPESVVARLGDVKMQVDYGAASLSQWVLQELLSQGGYDEYLNRLRTELKRRRDRALELLEEHFRDLAQWDIPSGGFYIWLRLNGKISIGRLFQEMLRQKILINPGDIYDFRQNRAIRISYAYADARDMKRGIEALAQAVRAQQAKC